MKPSHTRIVEARFTVKDDPDGAPQELLLVLPIEGVQFQAGIVEDLQRLLTTPMVLDRLASMIEKRE